MRGAERARRAGQRFLMLDTLAGCLGYYMVFPLVALRFVGSLHAAAAAVGLALALRSLLQMGLAPLGGMLADRWGGRGPIVAGMLLRACGFLVMARAPDVSWLMLSCVLAGLGGALFDPPRLALAAKLCRPAARAPFYARMAMGETVGSVTGALLGGVLYQAGFAPVCLGGALAFVLLALANALILPPWRLADAAQGRQVHAGAVRALRDRPFMALALPLAGYHFMTVQMLIALPLQLQAHGGDASAISALYAVETALALVLGGPLARMEQRGWHAFRRLQGGILLLATSLLLQSMATGLAGVFLLGVLAYAGIRMADPARQSLIAARAGAEARASYMGVASLGQAMGTACGYIGGGALFDAARHWHLPGLPWWICGTAGLVTCVLLGRRVRHEEPGLQPV